MAVDGRRCNSGASYSRAAMVKVMAMLPPTMRAIAIQNSMKIRRKRLCMSPGEGIARTPDVLDLGILARDMHQMSSGMQRDRTDRELVGRIALARAVTGAAQNRANPGHQLARIEGLAQVVIGPELQAHDPVDVIPARREHQDGRFVGCSELPQYVEAADARQHHIENQNFKIIGFQLFQSVAAVVHALHLEVLGVQVFGEHLTELTIVVHQQHSRLACLDGIARWWIGERHSSAYSGTVRGRRKPRRMNSQFLTERCVLRDTCLQRRRLGWRRVKFTAWSKEHEIDSPFVDGYALGRSAVDGRCRRVLCERGRYSDGHPAASPARPPRTASSRRAVALARQARLERGAKAANQGDHDGGASPDAEPA